MLRDNVAGGRRRLGLVRLRLRLLDYNGDRVQVRSRLETGFLQLLQHKFIYVNLAAYMFVARKT